MLANERRRKINELIQRNGAVTTANLVETFKVSVETVRRDLLEMEEAGSLVRVHGGAVVKGDMKPFKMLSDRNKEFVREKYALSVKAAEFISEGDIISVDSGSTAVFFAQMLREKFSDLTVVTHSLDVFEALKDYKDFKVILCGGHYLREENAFAGELTLNMLSDVHVNKAFVFVSAISLDKGIYDYQKEIYQLQKKMLQTADKVFVLADSSKFEKTGLLKLSDMKTEYVYITDSSLNEQVLDLYKENDIKIYLGEK